jgi:DNA repair protein RadC
MISAAQALVQAGLRESIVRSPLRAEDAALHRYLMARLSGLRHEVLLAFFADQHGGFLGEEVIASGGRGGIEWRPRTLFARALALDARAFLLVHNHPSGSARPSAEDLRATAVVTKQSRALEIDLIDHLIVAGSSILSMRAAGHL